MVKLNSSEVRKANKQSILRYILQTGECTKPQIAMDLRLSSPTVSFIVDELLEQGLLETTGMQASSGGRRAAKYQICKDAVHACGIEISRGHVIFVIVNLCGEIIATERIRKEFSDDREYIQYIAKYREDMVNRFGIDPATITGIGISLQGLISPDQTSFKSHMLDDRRVIATHTLTDEYPCLFLNDGNASCMSECYSNKAENDFVYLMLSRTVGGAIVHDGEIQAGKDGFAGEFGHVCLHPEDDKVCYCGGKGHAWCYLSSDRLEEFCGSVYWDFFKKLEEGEEGYCEFFDRFLDDLTLLIYNVRMMYNTDIVLGGYLGTYLKPYLPDIDRKLQKMDHLYPETQIKITCGKHGLEAAGVGAANYFIEKFISSLV